MKKAVSELEEKVKELSHLEIENAELKEMEKKY